VFQDDKQINNFLQMEEEFSTSYIDDVFYENDQELSHRIEVLQLKDNSIPRGLVPLEELFDHDDVARNRQWSPLKRS
jgi:hypothetical protein